MISSPNETLSDAEYAGPSFSVSEYLSRRVTEPSFVMVEFGHAGFPVVDRQPAFTGERAYIGIEAWLRDAHEAGRSRVATEQKARQFGEHVFYIDQLLSGVVRRENDESPSWYDGAYDPATLLPDQAADEVFASNVLCDPHIAYSRERTAALLGEMSRVLHSNGIMVLRETIKPHRLRHVDDALLTEHGLSLSAWIEPDATDTWAALETFFKPPNDRGLRFDPGSHYLIVTKR